MSLPEAPRFTPCPPGWREVPAADGSPTWCDPWPESGRGACADGEAHRPGEPACTLVGDPCPAGLFAPDLPSDVPVLFVQAEATGGDGTRALPFDTVAAALMAAPDPVVIALATGAYPESVVIRSGDITLWGACTDTVLATPARESGISVADATLTLRNLRATGGLLGVSARRTTLTLDGVIVEDGGNVLLSVDFDSTLDAEDVLLRRGPTAVRISEGTRASIRRLAVVDTPLSGVSVDTAEAMVSDSVLRSEERGADTYVETFTEGVVHLERSVILGRPGPAVLAFEGTMTFEDVLIGSVASGSVLSPRGLLAFDGAHLTLDRVLLEGAEVVGLGAVGPGTVLTARDVLVRDVLPSLDQAEGHGIEIGGGASADLTRVRLERATAAGLFAYDPGSTLRLLDVSVVDTRGTVTGRAGRALQAQGGAVITGERVALTNNREATVVVAGLGSDVDLLDATVTDTHPRDCVSTGCEPAGVGVGSYLGAHAGLTRFRIERAALAGVQLSRDGSMDLSDGEISDNPVGVNLQVPGYDVGRLRDRVYYRDNGVNVDSSELPVPEPTASPTG